MKKSSNHELNVDEDKTNERNNLYTVLNVANKQIKQRGKSKLTFGNLNQFNLIDETSTPIQQTSHTLPKASSKQLQNTIKLKSGQQAEQQLQNLINSQQLNGQTLKESTISQDQLVNLFGNLTDVYQFNSMFLSQLLQCEFESVQIAQCFVNNADGFHVYSQYCTNYPKQVETLSELNRNPYTNQLLKTRQIELGHSLPLFSYLLKPVQREYIKPIKLEFKSFKSICSYVSNELFRFFVLNTQVF